MKLAIAILGVLMMGQLGCAQQPTVTGIQADGHGFMPVSKPAWLPEHCAPGDFIESYGNDWMACVAKDKWARWDSIKHVDDGGARAAIESEAGYSLLASAPKSGHICILDFYDDAGGEHCPFETATGKVVGCGPAHPDEDTWGALFNGPKSKIHLTHKQLVEYFKGYEDWKRSCVARVALMQTHIVAEPDIVEHDELDHTQQTKYKCPSGFEVTWLPSDHRNEQPVCSKPRI